MDRTRRNVTAPHRRAVDIGQALLQERALGLVRGKCQGFAVGQGGILVTIEADEEVSPGGVEQVAAAKLPAAGDRAVQGHQR